MLQNSLKEMHRAVCEYCLDSRTLEGDRDQCGARFSRLGWREVSVKGCKNPKVICPECLGGKFAYANNLTVIEPTH